MPTTYEVEQKFRVDLDQVDGLRQRLERAAICWQPAIEQVDRYFRHPQRDFAETDEALRIRSVGTWNCVTYKGPKIDQVTKTRREIEIPFDPGSLSAEQFANLLTALSFEPVREVRKTRRGGQLPWQGRKFEVALDELPGLGNFVELETLADEPELEAARQSLLALSQHLGLQQVERRSYLEMLLEG